MQLYQLTNYIELNTSKEANSYLASQIPCLVWNLKVHYSIDKRLPLVPVLSRCIYCTTCCPISQRYII